MEFLLEQGDELVAVEVKWSQRIGSAETAGLEECRTDLKGPVRLGILLYPGTETIALDRSTVAVPFSIFFALDRP